MVASYDTVTAIFRVMQKHCSPEQIRKIVEELKTVPGNKSFRETVERLEFMANRESRRG